VVYEAKGEGVINRRKQVWQLYDVRSIVWREGICQGGVCYAVRTWYCIAQVDIVMSLPFLVSASNVIYDDANELYSIWNIPPFSRVNQPYFMPQRLPNSWEISNQRFYISKKNHPQVMKL